MVAPNSPFGLLLFYTFPPFSSLGFGQGKQKASLRSKPPDPATPTDKVLFFSLGLLQYPAGERVLNCRNCALNNQLFAAKVKYRPSQRLLPFITVVMLTKSCLSEQKPALRPQNNGHHLLLMPVFQFAKAGTGFGKGLLPNSCQIGPGD